MKSFGGVEKLRFVEDFPKPEIREDEVLIRVKAVALHHLDIWVRMGALAVRPELPHILGADIAHRGLSEQLKERKVEKLYRALVKGLPEKDRRAQPAD